MPKRSEDRTIPLLGEVDSDSGGLNIPFWACKWEGMPGLPPNRSVAGVRVRRARPEERLRRKYLVAERHRLGFLPPVGRGIRYVAVLRTLWPGLADTRAEVPQAKSVH